MKNASVSIVIPVFNRAHLVSRAIDSALSQTIPCEVILVDHGSTDDILSIVEKYQGRIRYIRRDVDNGPIACWRDGVEQATGEYLHFTYDDDWIESDFIEKCLSLFNADVAFVYTRATLHNLTDDTKQIQLRHPAGIHPVADIAHHLLLSRLTISPGCALFRRSDVQKNLLLEVPSADGIYGKNSGVGEDVLLFLLTSLQYKNYAHFPKPLANFLSHDGSITIEAIQSGKLVDLAKSYENAKQFYTKQNNAMKVLTGFRKILFRIEWSLRSYLPAGNGH
jgi:glycosyltransferase involved in cell wall biosynthesis